MDKNKLNENNKGSAGDEIEFLKYTITHLEKRIALIDNKASILIAVLGFVSASVFYIIKEITWVNTNIFFVIYFVCLAVVLLFLLQTIRPTKQFLGRYVKPLLCKKEDKDKADVKYVMWPEKEKEDVFPKDFDDYRNRIDYIKNNPAQIQKNYEWAHFILLRLVERKYKFYRKAIWAIKFWYICVIPALIVAFYLLRG